MWLKKHLKLIAILVLVVSAYFIYSHAKCLARKYVGLLTKRFRLLSLLSLKGIPVQSFSGLYFPVFGPITER